jgi:hypothetical protein
MEVSGQLHGPAALPSRERAPDTDWIGGWVGPRASPDAVVKRKIPSPRRESNSGVEAAKTVSVSIRYPHFRLCGPCVCQNRVDTTSTFKQVPRHPSLFSRYPYLYLLYHLCTFVGTYVRIYTHVYIWAIAFSLLLNWLLMSLANVISITAHLAPSGHSEWGNLRSRGIGQGTAVANQNSIHGEIKKSKFNSGNDYWHSVRNIPSSHLSLKT